MLDIEATVVIDRPADVILEWISDLERYRAADTKITKVLHQDPERVRYRGRLRASRRRATRTWWPASPRAVAHLPGAPGRWTRRLLDFEGGFTCERAPDGGGTLVRHAESFGFKPGPVRFVAEAYLRRWLQQDVEAEVGRLKALIEAGAGRASSTSRAYDCCRWRSARSSPPRACGRSCAPIVLRHPRHLRPVQRPLHPRHRHDPGRRRRGRGRRTGPAGRRRRRRPRRPRRLPGAARRVPRRRPRQGGRPGFDIPALSPLALLTAAALVAAVRQADARD